MSNSNNKVVILTGSSRGLGLAMAGLIAGRDEPITLLATSRGGVDLHLKPVNAKTSVTYPELDITDQSSVDRLKSLVEEKYGHIDVIINNAGVNIEELDNSTFGTEIVHKTFEPNYFGIVNMLTAFVPLMAKGGRVVNLSTQATQLVQIGNEKLHRRLFEDKPDLRALNTLSEEYERAAATLGKEDGWWKEGFSPAYAVSKVFVNLLTAAEARVHPDILFNAVCPGICDTTSLAVEVFPFKRKTAVEGSRVPLQVAFDDIGGVSGKFWAGKSTADTGPGSIIEDWPGKEVNWDMIEVPTGTGL